ncbi:MAG: MBL fold metallo-hydrolase [Bacteroidota bacterium]
MKIRWFGHACFGLTASDETRILLDPFDESVGYLPPRMDAAVVTVSHGHFDHSHTEGLPGNPRVLREPGEYMAGAVKIRTIRAFHDAAGGRARGTNLMFHFTDGDLRLLHAGDLGHALNAEQILACGRVDVLMIPVGGTYTVGAEDAWRVVEQLNPRVILPMHYRTDALAFPLATVDPFLEGRPYKHLPYAAIELTEATLPKEREIIVMNYV